MEIALISEQLFKENSPVTANTDLTELVPYIVIVQKMYIKPILGQPLYDELQTQVKAASVDPPPSVNPISPANRALLIEIAPALSFYAVYQGLPFHWAAILNKGITVRHSENSDAITIADLAQLRRWVLDDAGRLVSDLKLYLDTCGLYPLYSSPNTTCGQNNTTLDTRVNSLGFGFPARRKGGCC